MKVATIVSEAVPFAKTGGLADVAGALPAALNKNGADTIVIMPGYKFIFENEDKYMPPAGTPESKGKIKKGSGCKSGKIQLKAEKLRVKMNTGHPEEFDLYSMNYNGVIFYFVRNDKYFARESIYGTPQGDFPDNNIRFGFFSKAAVAVLEKLSFSPDIVHIHDYHFAIIALIIKDMQEHKNAGVLEKSKIVFTIHNIAYQGIFESETLDLLGIDRKYFSVDGIEYYGKVNFMKSGIVYSDKVTTVSPSYSKEILTEEYGYGLDGILRTRSKDVTGIINGIDYESWNPETDRNIIKNYGPSRFSGKKACKKDLLAKYFNMDSRQIKAGLNTPLIGVVSRLSEQKGIDLITEVMDKMLEGDLLLIILGTGDEKWHNMLSGLKKKYQDRFSLTIGYSDKMSREIYAGADIFLMPSKYEPCGLGQLISLKYGTVPVVRNTGGLADTIIDITTEENITKGAQGFKFSDYSAPALNEVLERALKFYGLPKLWKKIILNGMKCNFSWDYSAGEYIKLFNKLVNK